MSGIQLSSKLCRVCLQSLKSKGLSLFDNYKHAAIFEHINIITNLRINEGDGLPDKICSLCLLEFETVLNFIQKCRNSDYILRNTPEEIKLEHPSADVFEEDREELIKEEEFFYEQTCEDTELLNDESILAEDIVLQKPSPPLFECHDCGNKFKSKCKLRVHWKKAHLLEQLVCKICKLQCKSYRSLHTHMKRRSLACMIALKANIVGVGKKRVYHCKDCDYKTNKPNNIKYHLNVHSGERPYICQICPKAFTQPSSLSGHMEREHKQYKVEITCQYCGKHIKGRQKVYRHLQTHLSTEIKCKLCEKVLKSKKTLQEHMNRHAGIKRFTCEICAKSFTTRSNFCNHKRVVHVAKKEKKFISCTLCEYKTLKKENLKRHTLKHTNTNVCCITCGVFFDNEVLLRIHQKRHLNKTHKCPECDVRFFSRKSIWSHVRKKHHHPHTTVKYKTSVGIMPKIEKKDIIFENPTESTSSQ